MDKGEVGKKSSNVSVGRIVMNTIRKYESSNGMSLPQLKKILRETKKLDIALHDSEIKLALKNAMDRGILSREGGSYKVVNVNACVKHPSKDAKTTSRTKKEHMKIIKDNTSTVKVNAKVRVKNSSKNSKTTVRAKKEPIKIPKVNSTNLNRGRDSGSGLEVGDVCVPAVAEDASVRSAKEGVTLRAAEEDITVRAAEEDVTFRTAEEDVTFRTTEEDVTFRTVEEDVTFRTAEEDANSPPPGDNDDQVEVQKQIPKEKE